MNYKLILGDCLEKLRELPDSSVQCITTSPPYFGLRNYLTGEWVGGDSGCSHEITKGIVTEKYKVCQCGAMFEDNQIGLENTPEVYIAKLVEVFHEARRVLKDDGTLWLNLGDSYWGGKGQSGSRGAEFQDERNLNGESLNRGYQTMGGAKLTKPTDGRHETIKPKDLMMIPARVAIALQADGWWLRSEIIWNKPNPMPESVTDRPTKSHEMIYLLTKSARYFYDNEAVREGLKENSIKRNQTSWNGNEQRGYINGGNQNHMSKYLGSEAAKEATSRNRRSVWTVDNGLAEFLAFAKLQGIDLSEVIRLYAPTNELADVFDVATKPFKESHFATFPPKLIEPCILAGTSEAGECPRCGKAWVRVVDVRISTGGQSIGYTKNCTMRNDGDRGGYFIDRQSTTIGFAPQCQCPTHEPVPQTVLDPFNGAGTSGVVALRHGRNYIGIELNPEYIKIAEQRLRGINPLL